MTYNEVVNIAKRLDDETKKKIDKEVEEKLEILKEGELTQEEMEKMEECLYMSLVIQEYLDSEYELLEEEKTLLLEEMEELYNEYGELLTKAKLEEKVSKKKRMALELMRIREQLFERKDRMKLVDKDIKNNRENSDKLKGLSGDDNMKNIAKENKDLKNGKKEEDPIVMGKRKSELPNPDKMKFGLDNDSGVVKSKTNTDTIKNVNKDNIVVTGGVNQNNQVNPNQTVKTKKENKKEQANVINDHDTQHINLLNNTKIDSQEVDNRHLTNKTLNDFMNVTDGVPSTIGSGGLGSVNGLYSTHVDRDSIIQKK